MELSIDKVVSYNTEDFVKSAINKSYDEKVHSLLFSHLVQDEYYVRSALNYEVYLQAQQNKLDFHKDILGEEKVIEVEQTILPLEYYLIMYNNIYNAIFGRHSEIHGKIRINGLSFRNKQMLKDYFDTLITNASLESNVLQENISFDLSRFDKDEWFIKEHKDRDNIISNPVKVYKTGMKLTRFFNAIAELLSAKTHETEKLIGRFRIDPNDKVGVFISAYLPSFIKAGAIGNSCLSQGGVNEHSTFMTVGYPNVLVVHDADFSYRAWLAIDYKNKYYTLAHTYPKENFFLQLMVHTYLKSKGFTQVGAYFRFPEYMDMGAAGEFSESSIIKHNEENKESYFDYSIGLFVAYSRPQEGRVACVYSCCGCDKSSIHDFTNENGYCDDCVDNDENHFNCADCGDWTHNDYSNYDADNDEYYCNHCYSLLIQKRDEEAERDANQETEEPVELTSVSLDYSLIKNAPSNEFIGIIQQISNPEQSFVSDKDITLLSTRLSKISNHREFRIFCAITAKLRWNSGHRPKDWHPSVNQVDYPFYIGITSATNSLFYLTNSQAREDNTLKDEFYLRYYYHARNKIHGQIANENTYEIIKSTYPEYYSNLDDKHSRFYNHTFTLADAVELFGITERTTQFAFDSLETLQMCQYILGEVGYIEHVYHVNIASHSFKDDYNKTYFEINNKGKTFEFKTDDLQGKKIITKDMILALWPEK